MPADQTEKFDTLARSAIVPTFTFVKMKFISQMIIAQSPIAKKYIQHTHQTTTDDDKTTDTHERFHFSTTCSLLVHSSHCYKPFVKISYRSYHMLLKSGVDQKYGLNTDFTDGHLGCDPGMSAYRTGKLDTLARTTNVPTANASRRGLSRT